MRTRQELEFFLEYGYFVAPEVLTGVHLQQIQSAFDRTWEQEQGKGCSQHVLLRVPEFIELIEHPPILERQREVFKNQVQLLQYDLLRQGPRNTSFPERGWHRDFSFPGDHPLSINTILFIDDITPEHGPTLVIPGSHRGLRHPNPEERPRKLPGELSVPVKAGSAIFINSAIWHSGARNDSDGLRRGIYLYYGYWWLKRYNADRELPWECLENASEQRLRLLGIKMPDQDLHMYDPAK